MAEQRQTIKHSGIQNNLSSVLPSLPDEERVKELNLKQKRNI